MKTYLLPLICLLWSVAVAGQEHKIQEQPDYYLNGDLMKAGLPVFDQHKIKDIRVDTTGKSGAVYITTNENAALHLLTLEQLRSKYVRNHDGLIVYLVDGRLAQDDQQLIDEDYILGAEVTGSDDIAYLKGKEKISILHISTRSEENLKKARTINIRGAATGK